MGKLGLEKIEKIIPTSTFGVSLAICSVGLTCFLTLCLTWRKCKKRGKRKLATYSILPFQSLQILTMLILPIDGI